MNRKGFTLIELLVTIVLLGIIAAISFVSINKVINQNRKQNCETLVNSIITATNEYVSDNRYKNDFVEGINNNIFSFTAKTLVDGNYLNDKIVNPFNRNEIPSESVTINVTLDNNYTVNTVEVLGIDCSLN